MQNIVLVVHLLIALALIGVVLLQRSEGGALGIGGGGGGGGLTGARSTATALSKVTWGLAAAFFITSLTLTYLATAAQNEASLIDRLGTDGVTVDSVETLLPPSLEGNLLPPAPTDGPALPPVGN